MANEYIFIYILNYIHFFYFLTDFHREKKLYKRPYNPMPARKGLLAPQNTFLDTIATRFDGTRK